MVQSKTHEDTYIKEGDLYPMKDSLMEKVVQSRKPVIVDDTAKSQFATDVFCLRRAFDQDLVFRLFTKDA
ncbi:MAG: hypothetical protein HS127_10405 [Planctomycetia bacterium]|nr:hypothetical protein [Planctomycetia bacterium]